MSIARYLREIGRGREGARSLGRDDAHDLMTQVLERSVSDLEIGAFALAMRIKGESVSELVGFLDAAAERCISIETGRPTVVLPSYNGSRRVPNLTPLLAMLLAEQGVQVLVHGGPGEGGRITSAEIFHGLGLVCAAGAREIEDAWSRGRPAFIGIAALCPPLSALIEVRKVVGLRNPGHTIAKLLPACRRSPVLRIVNYTHPEYGARLAEFLAVTGADALLMRGTEGEPVVDARRLQKVDVFLSGASRPDLSLAGQSGVVTELPVLPRTNDAVTTASFVQSIVSGAVPAPAAITAQVECVMRTLAEIDGRQARKASA